MRARALAAALLTGALLLASCGPDEPTPAPEDEGQDTDANADGDAGEDVDEDAGQDGGDDASDDPLADPPTQDADTDTDGPPDPFTDPGPWSVGYQRHETSWTPPGAEAPRTIRVVIWYPTEATDGPIARYADLYPRQGVLADAPPALTEPLPALVFSHGSGGIAEQSWFMMEFFASHGWIVVAMDHPGNTLLESEGALSRYIELRPLDVRAAMDYIDALEGPQTLAGRFGDARLMVGHSFGGYTALAVAGAAFDIGNLEAICADFDEEACPRLDEARERLAAGYGDPRIKAAVPMTPGGYVLFGAGLADIEVPTLLMTGAMDKTLPEAEEGDLIWAGLDGPDDRRLIFRTGGHFTPSNICEIVPTFGEDDGCGAGFIPAPEAHVIINAWTLAFARLHLFGDEEARVWMEGEGLELLGEQVQLLDKGGR